MRLINLLRRTLVWCMVACTLSVAACSTSSTAPAARSGRCALLTPHQFEAVLGPRVGPSTNQALPLPNGVTGHSCGAIARNGDTFLIGQLRFPTSAAAAQAYNGDTSRAPVATVRFKLPHGLATRQYAVLYHQGGLNSAVYLLRGRDELTFLVATTAADEHLFNERAYRDAIVTAAHNWHTD